LIYSVDSIEIIRYISALHRLIGASRQIRTSCHNKKQTNIITILEDKAKAKATKCGFKASRGRGLESRTTSLDNTTNITIVGIGLLYCIFCSASYIMLSVTC